MSEVHDNELISYTVDFRKKEMVLNTEYCMDHEIEQTKVVFTNVTAHFFEMAGELFTIIFDIECNDIKDFIEEQGELLLKYKNYGWPLCTYKKDKDLLRILMENNQKYYTLESSCGMSGFVIAENMNIEIVSGCESEVKNDR